jgi:hypothetical protein
MSVLFPKCLAAIVLFNAFVPGIATADSDSAVASPFNRESSHEGFHWKAALAESLLATTLANGERFLNEKGTRDALHGPFWSDYLHSVENFHGWNDGDGFLTSYIAHPMEGAFAGFVERQNDPRYRDVEFGSSERYWISCMRSLAFSTAYSVSWSLGPLGESGLGNVQLHSRPGVVDLVGTETMGLAWMIGEDAIDRYLLKRIERKYHNPFIRVFSLGMLNPMRSYANLLRFHAPSDRDSRPEDIRTYEQGPEYQSVDDLYGPHFRPENWPLSTAFELSAQTITQQFLGPKGGTCIGAGGQGGIKVQRNWELVFAMDGCQVLGVQRNDHVDTLNYMAGPRWTPAVSKRWIPYAQLLVGGTKVTHAHVDPEKKEQVIEAAKAAHEPEPEYAEFSTEVDTNGLTMLTGGGVLYQITHGLMFRVASLDYQRSWVSHLEGNDYTNGLRFSIGLDFRLGPWRN